MTIPFDCLDELLPLQSIFQLLSAIFLSFCFEDLSNQIWNIQAHSKKLIDSLWKKADKLKILVKDNETSIREEVNVFFDKTIEKNTRDFLWPSLVGIFCSIFFLFITGNYHLYFFAKLICKRILLHDWILLIVILPFFAYLFLYFRTPYSVWKYARIMDFINDKHGVYIQLIALKKPNCIKDENYKNQVIINELDYGQLENMREKEIIDFSRTFIEKKGRIPKGYRFLLFKRLSVNKSRHHLKK